MSCSSEMPPIGVCILMFLGMKLKDLKDLISAYLLTRKNFKRVLIKSDNKQVVPCYLFRCLEM